MPALHRHIAGGIGAHAALAQAARQEAKTKWRAAGGEALLQDGEETAQSLAYFEEFRAQFVDEKLRQTYLGKTQAPLACPAVAAERSPVSVALQAEAALVAERSHPGRPSEDLCTSKDFLAGKGQSWRVQPAVHAEGLQSKSARVSCSMVTCRHVVDGFCSAQQCRSLCGCAIRAMMGVPATSGQTTIAAGPWLGHDAGACVLPLVERARTRIASELQLAEPLFFAGAVLSRIVPDDAPEHQLGHRDVDDDGPYCPHIDRARVASDDYAAVLYLGTQGQHFDGGGLAFMDAEADRWVAPRQARLLFFSAGSENVHRVGRVTRGARFALAMWFTLSNEHAVHATSLADLEVRLQADPSRTVHISSPSLRISLGHDVQQTVVDPEVYDIVAEGGDDIYDRVD